MSHETESDVKFEEKLTFGSKNDMRISVNFNASSGKSGNLHLMYYFCQWYIKFQPKKYRRIISHDTEKRSKPGKKLTFYLKKDMRDLVNFNLSSGKSENLHFDWLLL